MVFLVRERLHPRLDILCRDRAYGFTFFLLLLNDLLVDRGKDLFCKFSGRDWRWLDEFLLR